MSHIEAGIRGAIRSMTVGVVIGLAAHASFAAAQSHLPDPIFHDSMEGISGGVFRDDDAARFLAQATFGPTQTDIDALRQLSGGYVEWLNNQFAAPSCATNASYCQLAYTQWIDIAYPTANIGAGAQMEAWFLGAIGGADPSSPILHTDQLRQRVAFALSEIFVVSQNNPDLQYATYGLADYYDTLSRSAFGNFRDLLEKVTLHPVMGLYLSMRNNPKPDPARFTHPDQNYAREVLQLFSIGLVNLNMSGTVTPDMVCNNGQTATYSQATVEGFASIFTGWTNANCATANSFGCGLTDILTSDWTQPMQAVDAYHDSASSKQLLCYDPSRTPNIPTDAAQLAAPSAQHGVLPAGGTAQADLEAALDNIFYHPNVGPFIGKQLIQRLVTSNPSPAYVQRVATVFNDDGMGTRGNLQAVVQAILLDQEARYGQWQQPNFGKVREPLLRLTHLWRALNAHSLSGRFGGERHEPYGQGALRAPTVFNFFGPEYMPSGELTTLGLVAPEQQLATDNLNVSANNDFGWNLYWYYVNGGGDSGDPDSNGVLVDFTSEVIFFGSVLFDPAKLLERYNAVFMSGQMSPFMRQALLNYLDNFNCTTQPLTCIEETLYLILSSPEYTVQN